MKGEIGCDGGDRVARGLDALKRRGSNILLVGAGSSGAHDVACRRLCGTARDPRYRLFVTDESTGAASHSIDDERSRSIDYESIARTSTDAAGSPLEALGLDVIETIDAFDADADGLAPSQLRVCVGPLATLLQEHDTERVFRLVHVVSSRIEGARGMGHYHLPVNHDHDAVRLLEPVFDATVGLRDRRDGFEQRWHLHDAGVRTDWIPL